VNASASRQYAIATSSLAGAAQTLQQASAGAAGAILNPEGADVRLGTSASTGASAVPAPTRAAGFRTPFREDGGLLYLIDQRKLPHEVVEYPCRSAGEVAFAIRELIVRGAPAIGQAAAIGLAIAAEAQRDGRPDARNTMLIGAANALINARPTAVNLRWAVERVLASAAASRPPASTSRSGCATSSTAGSTRPRLRLRDRSRAHRSDRLSKCLGSDDCCRDLAEVIPSNIWSFDEGIKDHSRPGDEGRGRTSPEGSRDVPGMRRDEPDLPDLDP
jgi:hypothetical protein